MTERLSNWIICPECRGDGATSQHLGVIDPDDWGWNDKELELYMRGGYDRTCSCCKGSGKIRQSDYSDYAEREAEARADYRLRCLEDGIRPEY